MVFEWKKILWGCGKNYFEVQNESQNIVAQLPSTFMVFGNIFLVLKLEKMLCLNYHEKENQSNHSPLCFGTHLEPFQELIFRFFEAWFYEFISRIYREFKLMKIITKALLQEIVSVYYAIDPPTLSAMQSNRVCNALALLQCVASHPDTRQSFLQAHIPLFLYPFLNTSR